MNKIKKVSKPSQFKCIISIQNPTLIRPRNTYFFNEKLDKKVLKENTNLKKSEVEFYSVTNCSSDEVITTLEYNCSDKYKDLKDLTLIDLHQSKGFVLDQWTEKKHPVDCKSILSN